MEINTLKDTIKLEVETDIDIMIIGKLEKRLKDEKIRYKLSFDNIKLTYLETDRWSFSALLNKLLL